MKKVIILLVAATMLATLATAQVENLEVEGRALFSNSPDGPGLILKALNSVDNWYFGLQNSDDLQINNGESRIIIKPNGNVGINRPIPFTTFHVGGTIRASGSSTSGEMIEIGHGGTHAFINTVGDGTLEFRHDGNSFMSLTGGGRLGIGTRTPSSKLTILDNRSDAITIKTLSNEFPVGLAFQNSGNAYTWNIYREDAGSNDASLVFKGGIANSNINSLPERFRISAEGKVTVGIVDNTPGNYMLYVQDGIMTEEVKVALQNSADWSDDAFDRVPKIKEVESSINEKSHLIDMPSANQLVETGYSVTDMDSKLLAQIEWLWLHMIDMQEQMQELIKANAELKEHLKKQLSNEK